MSPWSSSSPWKMDHSPHARPTTSKPGCESVEHASAWRRQLCAGAAFAALWMFEAGPLPNPGFRDESRQVIVSVARHRLSEHSLMAFSTASISSARNCCRIVWIQNRFPSARILPQDLRGMSYPLPWGQLCPSHFGQSTCHTCPVEEDENENNSAKPGNTQPTTSKTLHCTTTVKTHTQTAVQKRYHAHTARPLTCMPMHRAVPRHVIRWSYENTALTRNGLQETNYVSSTNETGKKWDPEIMNTETLHHFSQNTCKRNGVLIQTHSTSTMSHNSLHPHPKQKTNLNLEPRIRTIWNVEKNVSRRTRCVGNNHNKSRTGWTRRVWIWIGILKRKKVNCGVIIGTYTMVRAMVLPMKKFLLQKRAIHHQSKMQKKGLHFLPRHNCSHQFHKVLGIHHGWFTPLLWNVLWNVFTHVLVENETCKPPSGHLWEQQCSPTFGTTSILVVNLILHKSIVACGNLFMATTTKFSQGCPPIEKNQACRGQFPI